MALENYIINASNTGAAGYHNAMAGMDQRKREAEVDRHNAFNRMHVDRQYRDKRMADAFEQAALAYDDNDPSAALGLLNGVSTELNVAPPVPEQIVPALRTRRQQLMAEGLPNTPSNVQEWQYYSQLTPAQQQQYLLMKRAGMRIDLGGGGQGILNPGAVQAETVVPPEVATARDAARAGAEQAAVEKAKTGAIPSRTEAEIQSEMDKAESKRQQTARFDLPSIEAKANQTLAVIDGLLNSKGFDKIFGAASYVPIVRGSDRADAFAYLSQIQGRAFLEAFETLKGGGQITQIEGEKATAAIARLEQAQSAEAAREALAELKGIVEAAVEKARKSAGVSRETLSVGTVEDGYVYVGGDPADEKSWVKQR